MDRRVWRLSVVLSSIFFAAPVAAALPQIHYTISPENVAGRFTGLQIRMDMPASAGRTYILDVPENLRSRMGPSGFTLEGGQWTGKLGGNADKLALKATGTHLKVSYRLSSDGAETLRADGQAMAVHARWFSFRGDEGLVTPQGRSGAMASVDIATLPGWTITSSLHGRVPLSRVGDSQFLGGSAYRISTRIINGTPFRLTYPQALSSQAEALLDDASAIITAERQFWRTPANPVSIGLVELDDDSDFSGRGLADGFSLYLGNKVERKAWRRLIAHENLHSWISRAIGGFPETDSNLEAWLNEGFTEAYTARLLLSSGLWTEQDYIDDWNLSLARYGTSPVKIAPNSRILADRERDFDVNWLPYDRGRILAVIWDRAFRTRTRGRAGLSDILRAQMADATHNARTGRTISADQLFPKVVKRLTGMDLSADLVSYVDKGGALTLPGDIFGRCVTVETVTQPVFDRGFDLEATFRAHGKLTGLEAGGPAERAGLKDGDKLRIDETPTNDSRVTLSYRVDDGDKRSHTVSYRPEGAGTVTFQQLVLKPDAASDCSLDAPR